MLGLIKFAVNYYSITCNVMLTGTGLKRAYINTFHWEVLMHENHICG